MPPPRLLPSSLRRTLIPLPQHPLLLLTHISLTPHKPAAHRQNPPRPTTLSATLLRRRHYATKTPADEAIEEITELYATAKDEFEIASEETDKHSVYAADDRAAAREAFEALKRAYEAATMARGSGGEEGGGGGEEVRRRVGQRVRELEAGLRALEERGREDG
ncbi:MAG: hypothetical protein LQ345_000405 [Seirophora villosa]|nr:MAG: hypothetical protein LQ345_000405 [Seirophora villosa]